MWPFDIGEKKRIRELVQRMSIPDIITPDRPALDDSQWKLMFVCDDMMSPYNNYNLISGNSANVSRGFTRGNFDYRMGRHTGRGLPFQNKDGLKIKGQIHAVETARIPDLDKHYKNGVEFARVRVDVLVTDRKHQLVDIGGEHFLKELPSGAIRTVPELGLRHYLSNPFVCVVHCDMYVAIKSFWFRTPKDDYPHVSRVTPREPKLWLEQYYRYPLRTK